MRTMIEEKTNEGNTGDRSESLKQLDEKAIEEENLVNTVEERLANLGNLEKDVEVELDEVDEELETSTPAVPEDKVDEQAAVESDLDTKTEAEEVKDGKDVTVSIPDALVRAAIHNGWEQADVDALIETNPELALKTLTSNYNSVTNASKEWSALGRAKIQSERDKVEVDTKVVEQAPSLTPAEKEKLIADYGTDPVVARLIANADQQPPKPAVAAPVQPSDLYNTATARANAAANSSVDQRVNSFFSNNSMSLYKEFYGELGLSQSVNDLSNGQQEHRLNVLDHAECIMTGLRMRGIDATVEEALEKAHLIVTEPIREQVIRNGLKKTAISRKKTLMPSRSKKSGNAVNTGNQQKPKDRQELVDRVSQRLANTFKGG